MNIYLDHNATAPLDSRALDVMQPWLIGVHGNPASVHRFGREAHAALEKARGQVAVLVHAEPAQVVFTGGGTESDNLALKGVCGDSKPGVLLVGAIEHSAVLGPAEALAKHGWKVEYVPVDGEGRYDLKALDKLLTKREVRLVSLMLANNETGVIQDIKTLAVRVHLHGALLHTDAAQAVGRLPVDFADLGADLMTLSAHKINGPRGVGALIMNRRVDLEPLVHGGGQEQGLRGGTENLAGIVGFGAAAELAGQESEARMRHARELRDRLQASVATLPGAQIFSGQAERLDNTLQFSLAGINGEWLVMELDKRSIAVSSGSACHSGSGKPSHVLTAMGIKEDTALGALRVSFGWGNSAADVEALVAALRDISNNLADKGSAVGW
jgi:cysteine desulfurase